MKRAALAFFPVIAAIACGTSSSNDGLPSLVGGSGGSAVAFGGSSSAGAGGNASTIGGSSGVGGAGGAIAAGGRPATAGGNPATAGGAPVITAGSAGAPAGGHPVLTAGGGGAPISPQGGAPDVGGSGGNTISQGGDAGQAACVPGEVVAPSAAPPIRFVFDRSPSMADAGTGTVSKWQIATAAFDGFVDAANGISVGLGFFPIAVPMVPATCSLTTDNCGVAGPCAAPGLCEDTFGGILSVCDPAAPTDCTNQSGDCIKAGLCQNDPGYVCTLGTACGASPTDGTDLGNCVAAGLCSKIDCDADEYAPDAVAISALPAGAHDLTHAIAAEMPITGGGSPTGVALAAAIATEKQWATDHGASEVVLLLATDGSPNECSQSAADIAQIVSAARAGTPKISTYVVAFLAASDAGTPQAESDLNAISQAGNGAPATVVDWTVANAQANIQTAFTNVAAGLGACRYRASSLPAGAGAYQVVVHGASGDEAIPLVADEAHCSDLGAPGYFVDGTGALVICATTCAAIAKNGGEVDLTYGCASD